MTPTAIQIPARWNTELPSGIGPGSGAATLSSSNSGSGNRLARNSASVFVRTASRLAKNEMTPHQPVISVRFCAERPSDRAQERQKFPENENFLRASTNAWL